MIAMGCDEIIMDERGELGPIDPQMSVGRPAPAQAILDQFEKARDELAKDPTKLPAWVPILQQMGPSLLVESDNAIALSKILVRKWLEDYMFASDPDGPVRAAELSDWLGHHNNFGAHGRMVSVDDLLSRGAKIIDLRIPEHQNLREHIWRMWSAYAVTFDRSGSFKIFESSRGARFIQSAQRVIIGASGPPQPSLPPGQVPQPTGSPASGNRAQRRAGGRQR